MDPNETTRGVRAFRAIVGIAAVIALSPVLGMILVFAILPALPVVLALAACIMPMNWSESVVEEAPHRFGPPQWGGAHGLPSMT